MEGTITIRVGDFTIIEDNELFYHKMFTQGYTVKREEGNCVRVYNDRFSGRTILPLDMRDVPLKNLVNNPVFLKRITSLERYMTE